MGVEVGVEVGWEKQRVNFEETGARRLCDSMFGVRLPARRGWEAGWARDSSSGFGGGERYTIGMR